MKKSKILYTLAGLEPTIFCSVGGDDDHYTPLPGRILQNLSLKVVKYFLSVKIGKLRFLFVD
jgi:hypothetical protein